MRWSRQISQGIPYTYSLLPFVVVGLSTLSFFDRFADQLFIGSLILSIVVAFKVHLMREKSPVANRILMGIIIFSMLLLVHITGWFFSPFLFTMYLVLVTVTLLYSPFPSVLFVGALTVLFADSIQAIRPWYDILRIASLYTALPLSVFFSGEFLALRESQKKILILQDERDRVKTELERLQKNKLVWNDVMLRQSLSTARNYALYWSTKGKSKKIPPKLVRDLQRTAEKLEMALTDIKSFEQKHVDDSYL